MALRFSLGHIQMIAQKGHLFCLLALCVPLFAESPIGHYGEAARPIRPTISPEKRDFPWQSSATRDITPRASPTSAHGLGVFFTADFTYWTSREDGLGFAYNGATAGTSPATQNAGRGSVKHIDFDYDPGFKVGMGLNLAHDGWDLYAEYTWLRTDPRRVTASTVDASVVAIKPLWNIAGSGNDDLVFARVRWENTLNMIDVELGRNYYLSHFLTARPHVGIRGCWNDENYQVSYENSAGERFRMRNDQDNSGVGVRVGTNLAYYFISSFGLYGNFALSALWSRFEVRRKDFFTDTNGDSFVNLFLRNDFHTLKGVLDLSIGLRYDVWWDKRSKHFGVSGGWEEKIWFSHNQHFRLTEEGAHGDFVVQGLTLRARLDF